MNRTDRLQAILTHLQTKKVVTAQELAERFELSLRTIYRDLRALEEAGIPIGAEAGIGYYLCDNYSLPPVALTANEASALVVGAKLLAENSDQKINNNFQSALFKIKSVLRPNEKEFVENISQHIEVLGQNQPMNLYINEIQNAISRHKILKIKYKSLSKAESIWREVEAVGLCNYFSKWHLFAWCKLRNDYRDFRLDRIESLEITDADCQKKDIISIKQFLEQNEHLEFPPNISFEVSDEGYKYLDYYKSYYGFAYEEKIVNGYKLHFANDNYFTFAIMILNSGCLAKNIEPKELKEQVQKLAFSTYEFYCK